MDRTVEKSIKSVKLDALSQIVRREVQLYLANSDTSKFYSFLDDAQKLYAVVSVPHLPRPWPSRVVVMAQVVGDKVIIIEDNTDKPLVDALMVNGGVPREKIILAYAGEAVPTT
jgi:hypothetical protein